MHKEKFQDLTEWSSSLHSSNPSIMMDIPVDTGVNRIERGYGTVQTECIAHSSNNSFVKDDDSTFSNKREKDSVYEILMVSKDMLSSEVLSHEDLDTIDPMILPEEIDDSEGIITDCFKGLYAESKDSISDDTNAAKSLMEGELIIPEGTGYSDGINSERFNKVYVKSMDNVNIERSIHPLHDKIMIELYRICCFFSKLSIPLEEFSPLDLVYMQFVDIHGRYCVVQDIHEDIELFQVGCYDETWEVGFEDLISLIPPLPDVGGTFFSSVSNNDESLEVVGNAFKIRLEEECNSEQVHRKFDMTGHLEGAISYIFCEDLNSRAISNPKCEFCGSVRCCKWDLHCKMISLEVETWRRCGNIPRTDEACRLEFYKRLQDGGIIVNTCIVNYARKYFPRPPSFEESFKDYQDDMEIAPFLEFERNRQWKRQVQIVSWNAISFCVGAIARGLW